MFRKISLSLRFRNNPKLSKRNYCTFSVYNRPRYCKQRQTDTVHTDGRQQQVKTRQRRSKPRKFGRQADAQFPSTQDFSPFFCWRPCSTAPHQVRFIPKRDTGHSFLLISKFQCRQVCSTAKNQLLLIYRLWHVKNTITLFGMNREQFALNHCVFFLKKRSLLISTNKPTK